MRAFQTWYLLFFIVLYIILSFAALKSIYSVVAHNKVRRLVKITVSGLTLLITLFFVILFIWPLNVRNIQDYGYYLFFNIIFSIDIATKIPLAFSYLFGLLFRFVKKKVIGYIGMIISSSISICMIYGVLSGSREFKVNRIEIQMNNDLPPSFDGYRIVQISDLHLGSFFNLRNAVGDVFNIAKEANPDIILFTGDLVNNFSRETVGWEETFKSLTADNLCYSITGNHDYGNYTDWTNEQSKSENFREILNAHKNFGFTILNNENAIIKKGKDSIYIAGVENWGHPPFPQYANLDKAMEGIPDSAFTILLSHDPAHWDEIVKFRDDIQLTLSGHTHGMQWGISQAGFRFSLSYFARRHWAGLYNYKENYLNVNLGLGMVAIPWRINLPPEISVITLKRGKVD